MVSRSQWGPYGPSPLESDSVLPPGNGRGAENDRLLYTLRDKCDVPHFLCHQGSDGLDLIGGALHGCLPADLLKPGVEGNEAVAIDCNEIHGSRQREFLFEIFRDGIEID